MEGSIGGRDSIEEAREEKVEDLKNWRARSDTRELSDWMAVARVLSPVGKAVAAYRVPPVATRRHSSSSNNNTSLSVLALAPDGQTSDAVSRIITREAKVGSGWRDLVRREWRQEVRGLW